MNDDRHIKVVLVDDDPLLTTLIEKVFVKKGYEVVSINESFRVIEELKRQRKPDLILMDIIMPQLSGVELAMLLKRDSHLRSIPVVFLTGLISGEDLGIERINIGGYNYQSLGKPFEIGCLFKVMKNVLVKAGV